MKDEFLNVRIHRNIKELFEKIIEETETTKSRAIRDAIDKYVYIKGKTKPALFWSFNELEFLLDKLNDSDFDTLGKITAKNRFDLHVSYYKDYFNFKDPLSEIALKTVFTDLAYNLNVKLLDNVEVKSSWDQGSEKYFIGVTHDLGLNLSKYLKSFLQNYLGMFSFDLISEKITEKNIILEFRIK